MSHNRELILEGEDLDKPGLELAGEHITLTHEADRTIITFDHKGTGRVCGGCTLCCKLLPVPDLQKPAGVRCKHQRTGKGCTIYATRPFACRTFACRWLADRETAGLPRPDRAHYVIDITADHIRAIPHDGGEPQVIPVIQIWVDPAFPDAWRTPELRAYMLRLAEERRMATIIRFDSERAISVFPPPITDDHQWHEVTDHKIVARDAHEREVLRLAREGRMTVGKERS